MMDHPVPNPYSPPADLAQGAPGVSDGGRRAGWTALKLLVGSLAISAATIGVMIVSNSMRAGRVGFGAVTVVALVGFGFSVASLVQRARAVAMRGVGFAAAVTAAMFANGFMAGAGALAALMSTATFSRGRQLRRFGRVLLPRVERTAAWAQLPLDVDADQGVRTALAAQWRENGRTEHASVAAFARLTLDLMALGAPPALVAAANQDALDEIRHTELCFSLARALDGEGESPGPFPEAQRARSLPATRTLALAQLAVDSLVDGALHEGVSARVLARLVKRCEEPQIRAVLKEIAADEGRHAAHGWDVVAWCLAEGGSQVARALAGALRVLPEAMRTPLPKAAEHGGWEKLGIVGRALEAEELTKTRADLVRRVEAMIDDVDGRAIAA